MSFFYYIPNGVPKRVIISAYISGIVITHRVWDIIVLLADSGRIFVFASTKPTAIQKKSVSMGVSVARKVVIFSPHIKNY